MSRRPLPEIVDRIQEVLKKEKELSVRQIALKLKSEWKTVNKALLLMTSLKVVKERPNEKTKRKERLFSLVR